MSRVSHPEPPPPHAEAKTLSLASRTLEGFMLINSHNLQQSWAADIALAVLLLQLGAISALHS